jgi:Glyoxalase-like domain
MLHASSWQAIPSVHGGGYLLDRLYLGDWEDYASSMVLDHLFVFVKDLDAAKALGKELGLTETYQRTHKGQGTANICFCFENAFLELLFLTDSAEATSPPIARTKLFERSQWHTQPSCPVGIAWRLTADEIAPAFPQWMFAPEYLPSGIGIPVAIESDADTSPMLFQSPGTTAPLEWPAERKGDLQGAAGLRRISRVILTLPRNYVIGPVLSELAQKLDIDLCAGSTSRWSVVLLVEQANGTLKKLEVLSASKESA